LTIFTHIFAVFLAGAVFPLKGSSGSRKRLRQGKQRKYE